MHRLIKYHVVLFLLLRLKEFFNALLHVIHGLCDSYLMLVKFDGWTAVKNKFIHTLILGTELST